MTHEQGLKDSYDLRSENTSDVKHGVDGWGLEIYSRDEEVREGFVTVYGTYLYERTVKGKVETREVTRVLDRRASE